MYALLGTCIIMLNINIFHDTICMLIPTVVSWHQHWVYSYVVGDQYIAYRTESSVCCDTQNLNPLFELNVNLDAIVAWDHLMTRAMGDDTSNTERVIDPFLFGENIILPWRYSPNLYLGLPPCSSPFHFGFLDLRQSVWLLGRVISSS
jgi:hypothetical protein